MPRIGEIKRGREIGKSPDKYFIWSACVDCSKLRWVALEHGKPMSLKCRSCANRIISTKHGGHGTRIYKIWNNLIQRCTNPKTRGFKHYGGRGITVCEAWRNDFVAFRDFAFLHEYNDTLTIDRIDDSKGYHDANVQFIPLSENVKKAWAARKERKDACLHN